MPRKKKSATALFEVMSAGRTLEPVVRNRSVFHSPSLIALFKRSWRSISPKAVAHDQTVEPEPQPGPRYIETEPEALEPRPPRESWLSKLPKFHFDATNAVIGVSAVVIVVGLSMLIVSKLGGSNTPSLSAVTTADLRKQPADPAILDLPRRAEPKAPEKAPVVLPVEEPSNPGNSAVASAPEKRIINMNYLMIQSYQDEKVTREAAELLNKSGIDCTVIQGLPRWSPSPKWWCVVGTKGFGPRTTDTAEFQNYLSRIREVSNTFSGRTKWKQFSPQLYRWGADSESAAK